MDRHRFNGFLHLLWSRFEIKWEQILQYLIELEEGTKKSYTLGNWYMVLIEKDRFP